MILPQLRLLRLEHCDIGALETSETSTLCVESTADICPVSTEDIYPVSTEGGRAAGRRLAAVVVYVETG